jgi:hypothetical protein
MPSLHAVLGGLSDAELLEGTRRLVGRSNHLLAELLAHLAEVETRGIHRTRACSSLYTYCIYELRFSEDEAFRRVAAARLVKRFPALLDAVASGELHLTGLLLLGPHLTEGNLVEVLARARHRTKREIAQLVRVLDPLAAVPARIEPLGPAPARGIPSAPTWAAFGQTLCAVRELTPGDRPRDWTNGANDDGTDAPGLSVFNAAARATDEAMTASDVDGRVGSRVFTDEAGTRGDGRAIVEENRAEPSSELAPQRYAVQFTATEEYVRLVEEAQALLSHAAPAATLAEIQLRALRAFVAALRKQKYAAAEAEPLVGASDSGSHIEPEPRRPPNAEREPPRRRGRHIPAAVRRAVFAREEGRCSYADTDGRRCPERHRLEFHHLKPFAQGGEHLPSNVTLRCHAHNALAAEADFGRGFIEDKMQSVEHERFCRQRTAG